MFNDRAADLLWRYSDSMEVGLRNQKDALRFDNFHRERLTEKGLAQVADAELAYETLLGMGYSSDEIEVARTLFENREREMFRNVGKMMTEEPEWAREALDAARELTK